MSDAADGRDDLYEKQWRKLSESYQRQYHSKQNTVRPWEVFDDIAKAMAYQYSLVRFYKGLFLEDVSEKRINNKRLKGCEND